MKAEAPEILSSSGLPEGSFPLQYFRRTLQRGRLSQAYLFLGPEGSGRRRFARELAKAIFCREGHPCGSCPACRSIDHGNHPGVHVYSLAEGKTSIEIADSREIAEKVHLKRSEFLVAIVEEADRMTVPAANALLKTLEEPTGDAVLILIARSSGALLPTIISRCHRIPFPDPRGMELPAGETRTGESPEPGPEGGRPPATPEDPEGPDFFLRWEPREWITALFPEASSQREAVRLLIDAAIRKDRSVWTPAGGRPDAIGRRLEVLLDLRSDLDRNVNADLVLEGHLRSRSNFP